MNLSSSFLKDKLQLLNTRANIIDFYVGLWYMQPGIRYHAFILNLFKAGQKRLGTTAFGYISVTLRYIDNWVQGYQRKSGIGAFSV